MAGYTDALRRDGSARAFRALGRLEEDPLQLHRARRRYSHSPPPYTSNPSGTITRYTSPVPPSDEPRRSEHLRWKLITERQTSLPDNQFSVQTGEEKKRILKADLDQTLRLRVGDDPDKIAHENVKKRWIEQGIWNNKWNAIALGLWKHEEPLELESESETYSEAESSTRPFSFAIRPKPRRPKSDDEKRLIAERRVVREREREASRPFHQFFYQISKERKRIQGERKTGQGAGVSIADINTQAYENVKNIWVKRGTWNGRWGILPGMSWKHEEPVEQETADDPVPALRNPLGGGSHEAREAPARRIFGSPSPAESNHRQASDVMNTSQRRPSADTDSAGVENGDAERSPSASNSPPPRTRRRKPSHKVGQPQPVASASLGPVHSSKKSKAAGGKRPGPQQRTRINENASSDDLPLSPGVGPAEVQPSPVRVAPRRSNRIQPPVPSVAKDPIRTASTDLSKRAVRSKPAPKAASNLTTRSSAKPQGISKRQSGKTTRGKARKK